MDYFIIQIIREKIIVSSVDATKNVYDATHYTAEYINTLETSGVPPHKLTPKKGAVVMLLRSLNISEGSCNGTRLIIQDVINKRLMKATIANGQHKGNTVLILKVLTQPADFDTFGFEWERLQFPIKLAFVIPINKSQGQTLEKVALWLNDPCFSHGQLYAGASRVGDPGNIKFYIGNVEGLPAYATRNVVYQGLL